MNNLLQNQNEGFRPLLRQQQQLGGGSPASSTPAAAPAPPPTPPSAPAAPQSPGSQPDAGQQADISRRITAAQGQQSTILTGTGVDTSQGVKKPTLGG